MVLAPEENEDFLLRAPYAFQGFLNVPLKIGQSLTELSDLSRDDMAQVSGFSGL